VKRIGPLLSFSCLQVLCNIKYDDATRICGTRAVDAPGEAGSHVEGRHSMTAVLAIYAGVALVFWGMAVRVRRRDSESASTPVLKALLTEHMRQGRERLGAAEARIALLEERLAFHDGFIRVSPLPRDEPAAPLGVRVERVAQAVRRRADAPGGERETTVLRFPERAPGSPADTEEIPKHPS
jgi:hypothetical protein